MTATNDITGDKIKSKNNNKAYQENYDKIFRCKNDSNPINNSTNPTSRNIQLPDNKGN